ncbi:5'-nucleotidase domain-containing protein 1 [Periplaneta americana]|uniref:5'-nucleotidase domain-containing protein 1 n=1 Tax=Periplaneta americana TaxID=6978 RepID=UPI0037E92C9A
MAEQAMISVQEEKESFRLSDYDCIGFDLDNTICRYKLTEMVKLEYEVLVKYLVSEKGHNSEFLLKPLENHIDFLQKGLVFDFSRGNILQLGIDGNIQKASHGTVFMTDDEIKGVYGPDKKWDVSVQFVNNMLEAWNGPMADRIRTVSDYFDMPAALAFGRIVDSLDAKEGNKLEIYDVWPDILDGLVYMYKRENFILNDGGYFSELKTNPESYINKCSNNVVNWLRQIKDSKVVFMLTGSHVDFATFTATNSLGENWKSLFDVVVCYAKKPGFFIGARPFVRVEGFSELDPIDGESLELGNIYSQGNWQDLYQLLARKTGKKHPKCLYIGDNLIQDIYVPSEYTKCDTVAVIEELGAEGMNSKSYVHRDSSVIISNGWGSYFGSRDKQFERTSLWGGIIKKYSKICVPDLDVLAKLPLNHEFSIFSQKENDYSGYYPGFPISLLQPV